MTDVEDELGAAHEPAVGVLRPGTEVQIGNGIMWFPERLVSQEMWDQFQAWVKAQPADPVVAPIPTKPAMPSRALRFSVADVGLRVRW